MDLQHSQYDLQDPRSYVDTNEFNLYDLNESIEKMRPLRGATWSRGEGEASHVPSA